MISKSFKYSPYASPYIIKQLGLNMMNSPTPQDKESSGNTQNKLLNNSLFQLQLFSPAQDKGTPAANLRSGRKSDWAMNKDEQSRNGRFDTCKGTREIEICGRRLFQSPSQ